MKLKKGSTAWWKDRTWKMFSKYIRMRDYAKQDDPEPYIADCITCGKGYPIAGQGCLQAGHFITRVRGAILFDERNVHAQCYNCNIRLKGATDNYTEYMQRTYGQETIDELMQTRFDDAGFNPVVLEQMYYDYQSKLRELTDIYGDPFK